MLMIKELIFTLLNKEKKVLICSLLLDLISSRTVAPQKIWVDGPLSYSSIHKKKMYIYFAPKYVWMVDGSIAPMSVNQNFPWSYSSAAISDYFSC